MSALDRRHSPMVFVADLAQPAIDEADHHHLTRSLRVKVGEAITVSDGLGQWRQAVLADSEILEELGPVHQEEPRPRPLTVGFAVVKGDRSELIVQKLTELGIEHIVPFFCQRSVVRWDDKRAAKNLARQQRVAREAAMQSRNVWLPSVSRFCSLGEVLSDVPHSVMAEPGHPVLGQWGGGHGSAETPSSVLVGPEGGFTTEELEGRIKVGLPGNILRTESAAIAAATLLVTTAPRG